MTRFHLHMRMMFTASLLCICFASLQANADDMKLEDDPSFFTADFNTLPTLPSFSLLAPSGFTPTQDFASISTGGIINPPSSKQTVRGALSLSLGIALPTDLGVMMNIDLGDKDLSSRQELSFAVGKYLSTLDAGVSVGIRNITLWHDDGSQNIPSMYIAASKVYVMGESLAIVNAGLGNNDFRTITDTASSELRAKTISPFFSAAYYPVPQLSLIADYTAGIATLGLGIVPLASCPINLNIGVYDITGAITGNNNTSFILSVSSAYTF